MAIILRPHLVVSAGVPNLTPEGLRADWSPGTVFLLQEMPTASRMYSPLPPDSAPGLFFRSTCTMWQSVPPVMMLYPRLIRPEATAFALATT